jgi:tetratricopeptide (TPR) repeat protein
MPNKSKKVRAKKAKTKKMNSSSSSWSTTTAAPTTRRLATIEDWIEAGDSAFLQQDAEQAIELYTEALDRISVLQVITADLSSSSTSSSQFVQGSPLMHRIQLLEKRAGARLALSDRDGARDDYRSALKEMQSVAAAADVSADVLERRAGLFLYVGQLSEGADALASYRSGIGCLQLALARREVEQIPDSRTTTNKPASDPKDDEDENGTVTQLGETRQQLASAYCSVAELYLTDLCFEDNAEQECENCIGKALELSSSSDAVDAWQAMANLRLSQKRGPEAAECVLRVFDVIRVGCQSLAALVGLRDGHDPDDRASSSDSKQAVELQNLEEVQRLPGFEFRCQTVKLLLECSAVLKSESTTDDGASGSSRRASKCARAAIDVLGSLLAENDEVVEVWFLTGEAFMALYPPNPEMAAHYWGQAHEMLYAIQESLEQQVAEASDEEDEDELQRQLDDVVCQIEDVASKLADLGNDNRVEDNMEE